MNVNINAICTALVGIIGVAFCAIAITTFIHDGGIKGIVAEMREALADDNK